MLDTLLDIAFALLMTASGVLAGWWLHRSVPRRPALAPDEPHVAREVLSRLQELARHVAANVGEHSSRVEEINQELTAIEGQGPEAVVSVVAKLIEANAKMRQQLSTVEVRLQEQSERVEASAAEARTDALTGLANRRAFDDEMARRFKEVSCAGKGFSLIMADIDHFKRFNDTFGHQVGDEVLRGVSRVFRAMAGKRDLVARYGGEEFAVVLPAMALAEASRRLDAIRREIEATRFRAVASEVHVTASFGVAEAIVGEESEGLIRRADAALYAAKASGRNCGYWHDGQGTGAVAGPPGDAPADGVAAEEPGPAPAAATSAAAPSPATCGDGPIAPSEADAARAKSIHSREEFCGNLTRRLAEWRRGGAAPAVLLIRIDRFPAFVASWGRELGSLVLHSTSQFLAAAIREMDTAAEFGEATFVMLLPGVDRAMAMAVAERLRKAIGRCTLSVRGRPLRFTVSAAGAVAVQGDDSASILRRAEEALQMAAANGGNCVFFHDGTRPEPAASAPSASA